jgi:hypothetical protein
MPTQTNMSPYLDFFLFYALPATAGAAAWFAFSVILWTGLR